MHVKSNKKVDNDLIFYSEDEISFVKEPDTTDLGKLNLIRQKVRESGVGEVVRTYKIMVYFVPYVRRTYYNILTVFNTHH